MTQAELPFLSDGVKGLLLRLKCGPEKVNYFPNKALGPWHAPKVLEPAALLQQVLGLFQNTGTLLTAQLTEHILVLASVTWAEPSVLRSFSLQAFVIDDMTLVDAHAAKSSGGSLVHYYRCDHHPTMLGELFSHPTPHIHIHSNDSPRFALPWDGNPIASFLEFLYLNHDYDTWREWAREICALNRKEEVFDKLATLSKLGALGKLTREPCLSELAAVRCLLQSRRGGEMRCALEHDASKVLSYEL